MYYFKSYRKIIEGLLQSIIDSITYSSVKTKLINIENQSLKYFIH